MIADVTVSSVAASKASPITFKLDSTNEDRSSVGVSVGIKEGKPLEVLLWSSGGAIAGSLAGPAGAIIGAGAGALCGLLYSIIVVPHNGPGHADGSDNRDR